jgi:hypothetical protein
MNALKEKKERERRRETVISTVRVMGILRGLSPLMGKMGKVCTQNTQ